MAKSELEIICIDGDSDMPGLSGPAAAQIDRPGPAPDFVQGPPAPQRSSNATDEQTLHSVAEATVENLGLSGLAKQMESLAAAVANMSPGVQSVESAADVSPIPDAARTVAEGVEVAEAVRPVVTVSDITPAVTSQAASAAGAVVAPTVAEVAEDVATAAAVPAAAGTGAAGATAASAGGAIAAVATNPVTIAFAGVAAGALAAAVAAKVMADNLYGAAKRLEEFSPDIAGAKAENEMRDTFAMLRRSDAIGHDLAGIERLHGKFREQLDDVNTELLGIVLSIARPLIPMIDRVIDAADVIPAALNVGKEHLDVITAFLREAADQLTGGHFELLAILKELKDLPEANERLANEMFEAWLGEKDKKDPLADPIYELLSRAPEEVKARMPAAGAGGRLGGRAGGKIGG